MTLAEVRSEITARVAAPEPVDADDFATALARTTVTDDDEALRAALEEGTFREWKVFLHPTQRRLVDRDYSRTGPGQRRPRNREDHRRAAPRRVARRGNFPR